MVYAYVRFMPNQVQDDLLVSEKLFKVCGTTHARMGDRRKMTTTVHPQLRSGELKWGLLLREKILFFKSIS